MRGRVAVLGAGGFVGARFLEMAVRERETDVVPVVRALRSAGRSAHLGLDYRLGDASRPESLGRALQGCDVVVDLTKGDPANILRTTESVHAAAAAMGARLVVHLSSAVVYGTLDSPNVADDAPPVVSLRSAYAREKAAAERFIGAHMKESRVATVVLRPSLIWGPGSPYVLGAATDLLRGSAYLVGGGAGLCTLMHVDNLVQSILAVIRHPAAPSGFYHVGDDEVTTWRDFYFGIAIKRRLARGRDGGLVVVAAGSARPSVTREVWELQRTRFRLPTARFQSEFGRQNSVSFEQGMSASIAWLRYIGATRSDAAPMPLAAAAD